MVMGDFNLLPETESVRKIERAGYRNLISEFAITTTRGSLVKKMHPEYGVGPFGFQEYADYAFVTPGIRVGSFEVPDVPVSDHLPLILTIDGC
jgi:endonuclease/exonuclease/phosphatase family metal-dependent hydrolase